MYVHPQVDKHHRQALRGSGTQTKSAQSPSYETRFQAQTGQLTADLTQQQSSPSKHADTMWYRCCYYYYLIRSIYT